MTRFYYGTGRKISAADFTALANKYNIAESRLRAVAEVEARGSGYDSQNRLIALYEPHIAYRYTKGAVRDKLVKAGIAYKDWVRNYPKTSYDRIDLCASIAGDEIAAMSTSFGMGQCMGFNHAMLGFPTALSMVQWMAQSEANQLEGIIKFAQAKGIFEALKSGKWEVFAAGYNGKQYKANNYHVKLLNADRKWQAKLNSSKFTPVSYSNPTVDIGTKGADVEAVQSALQTAGYDVDSDGDFGGHTQEVVMQFQEANGLTVDGEVGPLTKQKLAEVVEDQGQDPSGVLGQPPAIQAGFFSRFGYWFSSIPFAGGLAWFQDWRILVAIFLSLIVLAVLGILAQDKIIKAYTNYKKAFEDK
jgi:hypothetical protein